MQKIRVSGRRFETELKDLMDRGLIPSALSSVLVRLIEVVTSDREYYEANLPPMTDELRSMIEEYIEDGAVFVSSVPYRLCELRVKEDCACARRTPSCLAMFVVDPNFEIIPFGSVSLSELQP